MSNVLFIGEDLPDCLDFAEGFVPAKKVFTSARPDADTANFESEGIFSCSWNRPSAISARAAILNAETTLGELDSAVLYFDAPYFGKKFELDKTDSLAEATDIMICGYQYFMNELLFRLDQKKEPFTIAFVLRSGLSRYDSLHSGGKGTGTHPLSNIVAAAQEAFASLAENISTQVAEKNYLSVLLVRCDSSNELYDNPKQLAKWLSQGFDTLKSAKNRQTVKQSAQWIKAGGKITTGFSLFK